ncbi:MAG: HigA family addiction module antitoxin [Spirochaetes bacterium]|nr:HigA family addiction module antitoxin [Spirochaetota bacterium]
MKKKIKTILPGEILEEEFLKPLGVSAYKLAKETKISATRISEIIKGKRRITVDTALRFSKFFGNTPEFWIGIQNEYDLRTEKQILENVLKEIHTFQEAVV